ncbi:hypothetical protein EJD96_00085 (plasmid) [Herbaspirillum seropedicae]|uniref:hypothetical protein n=1 Tax=Herbaspirillum seropedicae TaxID=964 RepID=UPI00111EA18E|nr:hypothetical protein [Herbaspirillum seropedicae]QDD62652.1 hypothetical protein EJD96_00085 [Herbaspirillum seropedicae]
MSDTVKLKAPKGASSVSVLGEEYKVVKGLVTVLAEHVAHLVGLGFTSPDGDELTEENDDPLLPAGVKSNLELQPSAGDQARQDAEAQAAAAAEAERAAQAQKDAEAQAAAAAAAGAEGGGGVSQSVPPSGQ